MTLAWEARTLFVTTDTVIEPQKEKKSKHKREKKSRHKRDAEGERSIITGKRIKRSAGDVADAEGELRRQALLAHMNEGEGVQWERPGTSRVQREQQREREQQQQQVHFIRC